MFVGNDVNQMISTASAAERERERERELGDRVATDAPTDNHRGGGGRLKVHNKSRGKRSVPCSRAQARTTAANDAAADDDDVDDDDDDDQRKQRRPPPPPQQRQPAAQRRQDQSAHTPERGIEIERESRGRRLSSSCQSRAFARAEVVVVVRRAQLTSRTAGPRVQCENERAGGSSPNKVLWGSMRVFACAFVRNLASGRCVRACVRAPHEREAMGRGSGVRGSRQSGGAAKQSEWASVRECGGCRVRGSTELRLGRRGKRERHEKRLKKRGQRPGAVA